MKALAIFFFVIFAVIFGGLITIPIVEQWKKNK